MWLCILTGRWFEETFENAQWSKMLLCILTSRRFEEAFENTVEKSQTNVTSVAMHARMLSLWRDIWKCTVVKSQTNATTVIMHRSMHIIWGDIWKHIMQKSQTKMTHGREKKLCWWCFCNWDKCIKILKFNMFCFLFLTNTKKKNWQIHLKYLDADKMRGKSIVRCLCWFFLISLFFFDSDGRAERS